MNKIDKIIWIIRNLKEEGMSVASAPTNNTGSGPEVTGYGASGNPLKNAGYDKLLSGIGTSNIIRRLPKKIK